MKKIRKAIISALAATFVSGLIGAFVGAKIAEKYNTGCNEISRSDKVLVSPRPVSEEKLFDLFGRTTTFATLPDELSAEDSDYVSYGRKILAKDKLRLPTGRELASLVHDVYSSKRWLSKDPRERLFMTVKLAMDGYFGKGLYVYNRGVWTDKGVYFTDDPQALGTIPANTKELEDKIKEGIKIGGVRFSRDRTVRFISREDYPTKKSSPNNYLFYIANFGMDGARQLREIATGNQLSYRGQKSNPFLEMEVHGIENATPDSQTLSTLIVDESDPYSNNNSDRKYGRGMRLYLWSPESLPRGATSHAIGVLKDSSKIDGEHLDHWVPAFDCI